MPTKNPLSTKAATTAGKGFLNNRGGIKTRQTPKLSNNHVTVASPSKNTTTINIELGASTSGTHRGKKPLNMPQSAKNQLVSAKPTMHASLTSAALTTKNNDVAKRRSGVMANNVPKLNLKQLDQAQG